MKRFVCFTLSLILFLSSLTCADASIVSQGTIGNDTEWVLDDNGILCITGNDGLAGTNRSIWYSQRNDITGVEINGPFTYMGDNCFNGLNLVESIEIPESVCRIGYNCFANCTSLTGITLPKCLSELDMSFIDGCTDIENIIVQEGNTEFCSCAGVLYSRDKSVLYKYPPAKSDISFSIPQEVKYIHTNAFADTIYLKEIYLSSDISTDDIKLNEDVSLIINDTDNSNDCIHEYLLEIHNPTCYENGYTNHKCIKCGYEYKDGFTIKLEHIEETDKEISPTCTRTGLTQGSHCAICNTTLVEQQIIPAIGHKYVNGICCICGLSSPQKSIQSTSNSVTKPPTVKIKKLTKGKKSFKLYWKKSNKINGYQIQYAINNKFSKGRKSIAISSKGTTSKTVKGLKSKKTYYIRIRAYRIDNGKKVYGKWSSVKKIKTK